MPLDRLLAGRHLLCPLQGKGPASIRVIFKVDMHSCVDGIIHAFIRIIDRYDRPEACPAQAGPVNETASKRDFHSYVHPFREVGAEGARE
jgi:hypothetical protein